MDLELPTWLDATFLATALQGGDNLEPPVVVTKFSAALAVAAGNNYLSRLYRVRVDYIEGNEEKTISLIIKAPFTKGVINEMMDQFDVYSKEPKVYKYLLPFVKSVTNYDLGPKSYYTSENNAIVLADLNELGFKMCDRYKQLDFPHCEQVLKTLAKFHAASVACKKNKPDIIDLVGKETFYVEGEHFDTHMKLWIQGSLNIVAGVLGEMDLGKITQDFILKRVETITESAIRLCKPNPSRLNVLTHGDLWVNNILFKYSSSGSIVDVKFLDFQVSRYATPAMDLIYFIWSSANEDVRESRLQELFETYRINLNSTLEELGCDEKLSQEMLHEDMKDAVDWVIITICNLLPIILCDVDDVIDVEDVKAEDVQGGQHDERFLKLYKGKHYRAVLPKIVEHFEAWLAYYK